MNIDLQSIGEYAKNFDYIILEWKIRASKISDKSYYSGVMLDADIEFLFIINLMIIFNIVEFYLFIA